MLRGNSTLLTCETSDSYVNHSDIPAELLPIGSRAGTHPYPPEWAPTDERPFFMPDLAPPGNKTWALASHHKVRLDLRTNGNDAVTAGGFPRASSLLLVWDHQVNGEPGAYAACSDDVVSCLCLRGRSGTYTIRHRYWMPVRQLVKGFRCPACTTAGSNGVAADYPAIVADWDAGLNWPWTPQTTPIRADLYLDLRCHTCGTVRMNQGTHLAGVHDRARPWPQGCPRCVGGSVSRAELRVGEVLDQIARPGVTVTRQALCAGATSPVDFLIVGPGLPDGIRGVVVEYDGWLGHRETAPGTRQYDRDCAKTSALTAAGYIVVRQRNTRQPKRSLPRIPGALHIEGGDGSVKDGDAIRESLPRHFPTLFSPHP